MVSPPICLLGVDAVDDLVSHVLKVEMHLSVWFSKWLCGLDLCEDPYWNGMRAINVLSALSH